MAIIIKEYDTLKSNGHYFIFLLAQIGIVWTFIMMFRACRAYLNICNYGFMLGRLTKPILPTNDYDDYDHIIDETMHYDYGSPNRRYIIPKAKCFFSKHLFREYGFNIALFALVNNRQ